MPRRPVAQQGFAPSGILVEGGAPDDEADPTDTAFLVADGIDVPGLSLAACGVRELTAHDRVSNAISDELLVQETQAGGANRGRLVRQEPGVVVGEELPLSERLPELVLLLG